jgi:hypothetical protein
MKNGECLAETTDKSTGFAIHPVHKDGFRPYYMRGDVFLKMENAFTGAVEVEWEKKNLITLDMSVLVARCLKDNAEPPKGIFCLAVGTGDVGWNPMSPPAATNTQRALYAELTRKTFSSTQFIDGAGAPTAIPTNVVDYTTTFTEAEAVGPLCEMGLLGGNISTNLAVKNPVSPPNGVYSASVDLTLKETLCNYLSYPVVNKPATSTLVITWRIST